MLEAFVFIISGMLICGWKALVLSIFAMLIGGWIGAELECRQWVAKAKGPRTAAKAAGQFFYVVPEREYVAMEIEARQPLPEKGE